MLRRTLTCGALLLVVFSIAALGVVPRWRSARPLLAGPVPLVWLQAPQAAPAQAKPTQEPKKKGTGKKKLAALAATPAPALPPLDDNSKVLSSGDSYDDFVSIAQSSDGTIYAACAAYFDAHDQIRLHKRLPDGNWSTRTYVPLVRARPDVWMPQLAVDAQDRVWVIWSEQTDLTKTQSGNWDLYARSLDEKQSVWGPIVRLTTDPKPDINLHVTTDAQRNIHVVWQGHPENSGDIQYCRFDGQQWSQPLAVTSGPASDWYPQVAVDAQGTAWIAFDSYRNGDYDVFLTSVRNGQAGSVTTIAASNYYEAHASVACAPDGRVWVAWERGGFNWGKDQGYWLRQSKLDRGTVLGSARSVQVAALVDGRILAAPGLDALIDDPLKATAMAGLSVDGDGQLWLRFRRQTRGTVNARGQFQRYWTENVTRLTPSGWETPKILPASSGRISVFSRQIPARGGGLLVAYSSDQREPSGAHRPIHDRALVAIIPKASGQPGSPALQPYTPPAPPEGMTPWNHDKEQAEVASARGHRVTTDGENLRIVRGDLHRHTELSWDVGPGNDGSYLDFYRYMIDVAEMDFGSLTDHQGGGHYAYHWWLTEKSADMYYLEPRFVPLYGYERSARFPDGHRNIFHSYRGVPVFPFQTKLGLSGVFPGVGAGDLLLNDTKLLYGYLHGTGGVAISHTSGTDSMGTDWRDNDPQIEPVVEIYQGARNSYEVVGGPRVHDVSKAAPNVAPGGYQEAGMVWNALAKGYRLGMTASSDHGSTHISYTLVYTPSNDREAILDSIRKRHTYGGTDNLIIEAWANGRFMGDEFTTNERPSLRLVVRGTAPIMRVDLVRNNQFIYSSAPDKKDLEVKYVDMDAKPGLNCYYFRVQQEDGEIAWASPNWIHLE
jgi:hypothetical protein